MAELRIIRLTMAESGLLPLTKDEYGAIICKECILPDQTYLVWVPLRAQIHKTLLSLVGN